MSMKVRLLLEPLPPERRTEMICGPRVRTYRLEPIESTTQYVDARGTQEVDISGGGWSLLPRDKQPYDWLRFWVHHTGAVRNGAELPAGRVCFSVKVWKAPHDGQDLESNAVADRRLSGWSAPAVNSNDALGKVVAPFMARRLGHPAGQQHQLRAATCHTAWQSFEHAAPSMNEETLLIDRAGFLAIPQRKAVLFVDYPTVGKFDIRRLGE